MTKFGPLVGGGVLLTGATESFREIAKVSWPNHQEYATRHNLIWRPNHWAHTFGYQPSWNRLWDIQQALDRGAPWIIFVDTDAVFVDLEADLLAHCKSHEARSVWMGMELIENQIFPSNGLSVIRNDEWGRRWIEESWALRWEFETHPWCEQAAAYKMLGYSTVHMGPSDDRPAKPRYTKWSGRVGLLPLRWMSTPRSPSPKPFLYHATNLPVAERVIRLREALRADTLET